MLHHFTDVLATLHQRLKIHTCQLLTESAHVEIINRPPQFSSHGRRPAFSAIGGFHSAGTLKCSRASGNHASGLRYSKLSTGHPAGDSASNPATSRLRHQTLVKPLQFGKAQAHDASRCSELASGARGILRRGVSGEGGARQQKRPRARTAQPRRRPRAKGAQNWGSGRRFGGKTAWHGVCEGMGSSSSADGRRCSWQQTQTNRSP